jgi:hypothetical protein
LFNDHSVSKAERFCQLASLLGQCHSMTFRTLQSMHSSHLESTHSPALAFTAIPGKTLTGMAFQDQIWQEFTLGSAIAPDLFKATVQVIPDLIPLPGGEVETPIHSALNWHYSRFGQQAQGELWAALLLNEDDSTWQAKLSQPRVDSTKTLRALQQRLGQPVNKAQLWELLKQYPEAAVYQKYETAVGNGARAYLPHLPHEIRQQIAQRYQVAVPMTGSF